MRLLEEANSRLCSTVQSIQYDLLKKPNSTKHFLLIEVNNYVIGWATSQGCLFHSQISAFCSLAIDFVDIFVDTIHCTVAKQQYPDVLFILFCNGLCFSFIYFVIEIYLLFIITFIFSSLK